MEIRIRLRLVAGKSCTALLLAMASLTVGLGLSAVHADTEYRTLYWFHMVDAKIGWALTHGENGDSLLRTTDGGIHWKDVTPLESSKRKILVNPYCFDVLTSLLAWVGPYRTVDGGLTWRRGPAPLGGWPPPGRWESMNFINPRDGWLISDRDGAVVISRSTDSGETWIEVASTSADNRRSGLPWPPGGVVQNVNFLNATTGWITGETDTEQGPSLYVTHDGGHMWQRQIVPLPPGVRPLWHSPIAARRPKFFTPQDGILPVYVVSSFAILYATHDGGTTWSYSTPVAIQPIQSVLSTPTLSFVDMNHGWLTDGHALYFTGDGGRQ